MNFFSLITIDSHQMRLRVTHYDCHEMGIRRKKVEAYKSGQQSRELHLQLDSFTILQ